MSRRQLRFEDVRPDFERYWQEVQANRHPIALLLDGVDDVRNVGALFRLADAARLEKIYSYQTEIDLLDKKLRRVARQTEQLTPYQHLRSREALESLKQEKPLIGLEWTNDSVPYTDFEVQEAGYTLVIGNEERGISDEVLELLDASVHIPMHGVKTSLNVAMATGIVTYALLEKWLAR